MWRFWEVSRNLYAVLLPKQSALFQAQIPGGQDAAVLMQHQRLRNKDTRVNVGACGLDMQQHTAAGTKEQFQN